MASKPRSPTDVIGPDATRKVLALFEQTARRRGMNNSAACRQAGVKADMLGHKPRDMERSTFLRIRNWITNGGTAA